MKRCFYFAFILLLSGGMLSSCLDNDEPKGLEELRSAMSELYKAQAQVQLSEVDLNKAEAALKQALVEQQNLKNKQTEVETEKLLILNEREKTVNEREKLQNEKIAIEVELKQLEVTKEQSGLDHQQALRELELKGKNAEMDTYLQKLAAEMKGYENRINELNRELELAVENHKKLLLTAQEDLARAEKSYQDALKEIEAQKILLTNEQQGMLNPVLQKLVTQRGEIKKKQDDIIKAERDLLDLMINFDPESYGKKLALNVTEKELLLADAQKMKEMVAVFNTKPFSEWEKQLVTMEDTLAKIKVEQDLITTKIAEAEVGKQPFENKTGELNDAIDKKNVEKGKLQAEKTVLQRKYNTYQEFTIAVPDPAMENAVWNAINIYPYNNSLSNNAIADPITGKYTLNDHLIHFNTSITNMNTLLLGQNAGSNSFGGILLILKNKIISNEEKSQAQLKLNDYNQDKTVYTTEYAAAKTKWAEAVTAYKKAEEAYGLGETRDQQVIAKEAWNKYTNIPTNKRVKKDTSDMLAAIKAYVDARTVLNADIPEFYDQTDGETKPLSKVLTYVYYAEYGNDVNNAISNAVSMPSVNNPSGGAYQAWNKASDELFGCLRLTELTIAEFEGRLILNDNGNINQYAPGWNEIQSKLKLSPYSFTLSLWFKKYKAEYLYDNLNLQLNQQAGFQKLYDDAVALQAETEAAIKAIDDEIQAVNDQIAAIDEEITALNEQISEQQEEIRKIDDEVIAQLNMIASILNRRYNDLDNIYNSILNIMGVNADGSLNAYWYDAAAEIKAAIEQEMNQYDQVIADAEGALVKAKKELERFNQEGDPQQTAISDKEQEIKELQTEVEELQKEFDELTAKKDHLMEIFTGSAA